MRLFSQESGDKNKATHPPNRHLARIVRIFTWDILSILASAALAGLSALVYVVGMFVSIDSHGLLIALASGAVGGVLAAPQLVCLSDTVLRSLRGERDEWWKTYKRVWKQNVRCSLLPGLLGGLLFGFQLFILAHFEKIDIDLFLMTAMALGVALSTAIATWLLPQLALMELPLGRSVLNATLLCVRHPIKTLSVTLFQLLYWGFLLFTFPQSLVLGILLNLWLPVTVETVVLYDSLEEAFHIEDALADEYGEEET